LHAYSVYPVCSACPGGLFGLSRAGEHFFVSGADRQVNETSPDFGIPKAYSETPVTTVTFGNDSEKKT
jgi:hypothetical protein